LKILKITMDIIFKSTTKLRVRYGETDQMGYCYYGNYAQYFEVGRVEALRDCGMSYRELEGRGIMLPVSEFSVNYFYPALYDDELTITTRIVSLKGARIIFEYEIHNSNLRLISKAQTTLVFVNKSSMRPTKAPDDFIQLLEKYKV